MRLSDVLSERSLLQLAGNTSFERGLAYFESRRVGEIDDEGDVISAEVQGSELYSADLSVDNGSLGYDCDCPVGLEGRFCKHCVALGLAWLRREKPKGSKVTAKKLRGYLETLDRAELIELLMGQVSESKILKQKLTMDLALAQPGGPNVVALKSVVEGAFRAKRFVDYRAMPAHAKRCREVIGQLADLVEEGHAVEAIDLTELAIAGCERTLLHCDDSDGYMGQLLCDLQDIHLSGCLLARPDPEQLAKRLFNWELGSEWDVFSGAVETYSEVLGENGVAVYRQLAEQEWDKLPPLRPGDDKSFGGKRFRVTAMKESLARSSGDIEQLVAIKANDLSTPYAFLEIAVLYRDAGDHTKALEWAKRGIAAFAWHGDSRLEEFLANLLHKLGRHEEAMEIVWKRHAQWPSFENYKNLWSHADAAGQWEKWRPRAFAALREAVDKRRKSSSVYGRVDNSEIVRVLLWEKDPEAAWIATKEGGCTIDLALELARLREDQHPEDALNVYRSCVEPCIERKTNDGYAKAVIHLGKVRQILLRLERANEFGRYVRSIQIAHKAKRNLMTLILQEGWDKSPT